MEVPFGQQTVAHTQLLFIPAGHAEAENVAQRLGETLQAWNAAKDLVRLMGEVKLPVDITREAALAECRQHGLYRRAV